MALKRKLIDEFQTNQNQAFDPRNQGARSGISTVKFDDDDEVKSPPSMVDDDRWQETELTEKKVKEEEGDWWVKYGSRIVDDNGFLLGEFRRLDEDLYMNIMIH
ncbi:hypothetical protein OSB04_028051 [Centaurea solstitialis]|uniref:Uncharacterized protein n=1 Tax=Centaurea solstitialis TaxID=347529 RepID=A0AA38SEZ3_9ASTR|nr:hypothetical protein OSB04_028051 [Centaurea solstitialis]